MYQPTPVVRDQRHVDAEHLKLLAIFHFVVAGLAIVGLAFLLVHYLIMSTVFTNPSMWQSQRGGPPPAEIFALFKWIYIPLALFFLGFSLLNIISGLCIRVRKQRIFSLVVAGANCLQVPLGTVLGIFTIVVLTRDSVREAYGE